VKSSGTDEPICVVIHIFIDTTQGITLYSYFHLKLAETPCFSYYLLWFFFFKIGEQEGGTGSALEGVEGEVTQIIYTHVSKCKNDEIK
jgi:hypothetical protein